MPHRSALLVLAAALSSASPTILRLSRAIVGRRIPRRAAARSRACSTTITTGSTYPYCSTTRIKFARFFRPSYAGGAGAPCRELEKA